MGQSQAGKGTLLYDHPQCLGAIGSTGTTAANALAAEADVRVVHARDRPRDVELGDVMAAHHGSGFPS